MPWWAQILYAPNDPFKIFYKCDARRPSLLFLACHFGSFPRKIHQSLEGKKNMNLIIRLKEKNHRKNCKIHWSVAKKNPKIYQFVTGKNDKFLSRTRTRIGNFVNFLRMKLQNLSIGHRRLSWNRRLASALFIKFLPGSPFVLELTLLGNKCLKNISILIAVVKKKGGRYGRN